MAEEFDIQKSAFHEIVQLKNVILLGPKAIDWRTDIIQGDSHGRH